MPIEIFNRIHDQVLDKVARVNLVGGGEPLVAEHFTKLLNTCLERRIRVFFITNGKELNESIIEKCINSNAEIMMSIDGATPETYNFIRPFIQFGRLIETLDNINRLRKQYPDSSFKLITNTVVTKNNIVELPELIRLLINFGVDSICLSDLIPHQIESVAPEFARDIPSLSINELRYSFAIANEIARSNFIRVAAPAYYNIPEYKTSEHTPIDEAEMDFIFPEKCFMPWTHCNFRQDGTITSCCAGGNILGNIVNDKFDDIWEGPLYKKLRQLIHTNNPVAQCKYCNTLAGISAGNPSFYSQFIERNNIGQISLSNTSLELVSGQIATAEPTDYQWLTITSQAEIAVDPGDAAFLLFEIDPDDGNFFGKFNVDGNLTTEFDTSDKHILVNLPRNASNRRVIEISIHDLFDSKKSATLTIRKIFKLSYEFKAKKASGLRKAAIYNEHGDFIEGLNAAINRWRKSLSTKEPTYGIFGIVDIGEVLIDDFNNCDMKFAGFFDHFAGNIRHHSIRQLSQLETSKLDALIISSPYQPEKTLRLLKPFCSDNGITLIHNYD
jgi:MoaA/NifB/PqqE/SkfB family radical SAM enzyme